MTARTIHLGATARCKSCGAPIVWAKTTSNKAAPFELDPNGAWHIVNGVASSAVGFDIAATTYTNHFATCEQASSWRKR